VADGLDLTIAGLYATAASPRLLEERNRRSAAAEIHGIASLDEARAYLTHPVLGPRLEKATRAVLATHGRTLHAIFGSPDDLKFHSSMTLFALTAEEAATLYRKALARYCNGRMDEAALALLGRRRPAGPVS